MEVEALVVEEEAEVAMELLPPGNHLGCPEG